MKNLKNNLIIITVFFSLGLSSLLAFADNHSQSTVLITGANRGIGLALADKFNQEGYKVIATARKPEKAAALNKLGVKVVQLDVLDPASVSALATEIKQPIDILINNAGISGHATASFEDLDVEQLLRTFNVNSLGALRVTQALLPNLENGGSKTVASISSIMGSTSMNRGRGGLGYKASKAALNNLNQSLANEYKDRGYKFVVLHPGWVRTDMGSQRATYSVEESAGSLFQVITKLKAVDNGTFYDLHGKKLAW